MPSQERQGPLPCGRGARLVVDRRPGVVEKGVTCVVVMCFVAARAVTSGRELDYLAIRDGGLEERGEWRRDLLAAWLRLAVAVGAGVEAIPFLPQTERVRATGPVHREDPVEVIDFVL
jgi:hypothetical protein